MSQLLLHDLNFACTALYKNYSYAYRIIYEKDTAYFLRLLFLEWSNSPEKVLSLPRGYIPNYQYSGRSVADRRGRSQING